MSDGATFVRAVITALEFWPDEQVWDSQSSLTKVVSYVIKTMENKFPEDLLERTAIATVLFNNKTASREEVLRAFQALR